MSNETMDRRAAVAKLLDSRNGALVVTGLGSPGYDVHAHADTDDNYYLWGAMGGAALTSLGSCSGTAEQTRYGHHWRW